MRKTIIFAAMKMPYNLLTCLFYAVALLSSCNRNYQYPESLVLIDSLCMSKLKMLPKTYY